MNCKRCGKNIRYGPQWKWTPSEGFEEEVDEFWLWQDGGFHGSNYGFSYCYIEDGIGYNHIPNKVK